MSITEAEFEVMLEAYMAKRQATKSARGRRKKAAIAPSDYDSMSLTEFSGQVNDSMSDCTELAINEFFEMERARKKGQGLKATGHGIKGAVGVGLVAYGIVELLSIALGGQD
jgi:hypothetical protein